ncbi:hypothetical protein ACLI4Z_02470 [Natrialbaceae archaeon A-arb3/5]
MKRAIASMLTLALISSLMVAGFAGTAAADTNTQSNVNDGSGNNIHSNVNSQLGFGDSVNEQFNYNSAGASQNTQFNNNLQASLSGGHSNFQVNDNTAAADNTQINANEQLSLFGSHSNIQGNVNSGAGDVNQQENVASASSFIANLFNYQENINN